MVEKNTETAFVFPQKSQKKTQKKKHIILVTSKQTVNIHTQPSQNTFSNSFSLLKPTPPPPQKEVCLTHALCYLHALILIMLISSLCAYVCLHLG